MIGKVKKYLIKILAFSILVTGIISCKKAPVKDCFVSANDPWTETRQVDTFSQIVVNDDINLYLQQGSPQQVQIEGGKNLTPNIATSVSGGVLTLKNNNICDWLRSYKKSVINVYVTIPYISYITNAGVGNIQGTDTITMSTMQIATQSAGNITLMVNCGSIFAHLFNTSTCTLTGKCGDFQCNFLAGTGFMYCDHLYCGYTYLSTGTTGDCYINSLGELDVVINKNGNVYYSGNPSPIHAQINGTGQLIHE
jgi:hypothetical protein